MPAKTKSKSSTKTDSKKESVKKHSTHKEPSEKVQVVEPTIVIPDTATTIPESIPTPNPSIPAQPPSEQTPQATEKDTLEPTSSTDEPQSLPDVGIEAPATNNTEEPANILDMAPPQTTDPSLVDQPTPEIADNEDFVPENKGGGKKLLLVFVLALLIGGGSVAGFFYFFNPYKQTSTSESPDETPSAVTQETPTPMVNEGSTASDSAKMEEVDASKLAVQILNGSGVGGQAGVVRDLLSKAGFVTFDVGNATSYDYKTTDVQIKEGTSVKVFEKIKDALAEEGYTVAEDTALPEDSEYDVVIVVGSKK